MSEKRRNWLILGVVVALMIGCGVLMTQRSFRLGLDLRGGLEVVLDARPLPGQTVTQQDLNTSVTILRKRIDPNGTLNPEIRSSTNPDQITIAIPGVRDPAAVASLLVSSGQLQSFDMFKYLNNVSKGTQPYTALPADSLYSLLTKPAVKAQAKSDGVGSWALFDANHKQLGKVEPQQSQVLEDYKPQNPVKPPGAQFLGIPKGTSVVSCDASTGCPGVIRQHRHLLLPVQPEPEREGQPERDHRRPGVGVVGHRSHHRPADRDAELQERRRRRVHEHLAVAGPAGAGGRHGRRQDQPAQRPAQRDRGGRPAGGDAGGRSRREPERHQRHLQRQQRDQRR